VPQAAVAGQRVLARTRLADNWTHHMIVPPVRIIIGGDHGGMLPLWEPLEAVQGLHEKGLLGERVRVAGMSVSIRWGLEEAHRGHIPRLCRGPKVAEIVLVIGLIAIAFHSTNGVFNADSDG
jgi:hypothetical protein